MGLFKTAEEKQREKELEKRIEDLDRFPGSLEEYNSLKGEEYVIMDTGKSQKFVNVDNGRDSPYYIEILITQGCTGFVRYVPRFSNGHSALYGGYGIPVKRK